MTVQRERAPLEEEAERGRMGERRGVRERKEPNESGASKIRKMQRRVRQAGVSISAGVRRE